MQRLESGVLNKICHWKEIAFPVATLEFGWVGHVNSVSAAWWQGVVPLGHL